MPKNILVLGGTGFFGIHMVNRLLDGGHKITIATRGLSRDPFKGRTKHIKIERTSAESIAEALKDRDFDLIIDNLVFCSNDVKYLLDIARTDRYIYTSTIAVYDENLRMDMPESHFDPMSPGLVWCSRGELLYGDSKRSAERAVFQVYTNIPDSAAVRLPYVIGEDDYTKRLYFYVEHVVKELPMNIDNIDEKLSFIFSEDAGEFIAWVALHNLTGPINGGNHGTASIREIISYVEEKTGKRAILNSNGDLGAYNGRWSFSTSVERAASLGFQFSRLHDRFYHLLDKYIKIASTN